MPKSEHNIPTDTQTTNDQEDVQEDEVGDSQESDITNSNNYNKEETDVQEAHVTPIESTTNKRSQGDINEEYQDGNNNKMNDKYGECSGIYNLISRKIQNLPIQYG